MKVIDQPGSHREVYAVRSSREAGGGEGRKKERKKTQAAVCTNKNALMVLSVGYI